MPRNSSGNYVLPSVNPVAPDTLIDVDWANPTMSDIGQAITDSLDRQGRGTMLAPLKIIDGSPVTPSLAFNSDSATGMYLSAPNTIGFATGGLLALSIAATGVTITDGLHVGGDTFIDGATTFTGDTSFDGGLTVGGVLSVAPGSAALPGLTFTGDPDTGIYSPAADTFGIATGGLGRMQVDVNGEFVLAPATLFAAPTLSVGTSPGGFAIDVVGNGVGADPSLIRFLSNGSASERMLLQCDTAAGVIGTTQALPLQLLTNNLVRMALDATGKVAIGGGFVGALSVWGSGYLAYFRDTGSGFYASVLTDATGPAIEYGNGNGFRLNDGATTRLAISSSGNVTLTGDVHINETVNASAAVYVNNLSAGANAAAGFVAGNDQGDIGELVLTGSGFNAYPFAGPRAALLYSAAPGGIALAADGGVVRFSTSGAQRVLIDAAGNVAVNSAAPGAQLGLNLSNTSATPGSSTRLTIGTAGAAAAGDPNIYFIIPGQFDWDMGVDHLDNSFRLSTGGGLTGNPLFIVTANGRVLAGTVAANNASFSAGPGVAFGTGGIWASGAFTDGAGSKGVFAGYINDANRSAAFVASSDGPPSDFRFWTYGGTGWNECLCIGSGLATAGANPYLGAEVHTGRLYTSPSNELTSISHYSDSTAMEMSVGSSPSYLSGIAMTAVGDGGAAPGTVRFFTSGVERMRVPQGSGAITEFQGGAAFNMALDPGATITAAAVPIGGIIGGQALGGGWTNQVPGFTLALGGANSILPTGLNGVNLASITTGTWRLLVCIVNNACVFMRVA